MYNIMLISDNALCTPRRQAKLGMKILQHRDDRSGCPPRIRRHEPGCRSSDSWRGDEYSWHQVSRDVSHQLKLPEGLSTGWTNDDDALDACKYAPQSVHKRWRPSSTRRHGDGAHGGHGSHGRHAPWRLPRLMRRTNELFVSAPCLPKCCKFLPDHLFRKGCL